MANISKRTTWRTWYPDVGDNRALPEEERLALEVQTGLTATQLDDARARYLEAIKAMPPAASVEDVRLISVKAAVAGYGELVRVVGKHTIDGAPVESFEGYFAVLAQAADAGAAALGDVAATVRRFNDFGGPDELFSPRRSGGPASMPRRSAAKDTPATDAPSSGSPTPASDSSGTAPTTSPAGG